MCAYTEQWRPKSSRLLLWLPHIFHTRWFPCTHFPDIQHWWEKKDGSCGIKSVLCTRTAGCALVARCRARVRLELWGTLFWLASATRRSPAKRRVNGRSSHGYSSGHGLFQWKRLVLIPRRREERRLTFVGENETTKDDGTSLRMFTRRFSFFYPLFLGVCFFPMCTVFMKM